MADMSIYAYILAALAASLLAYFLIVRGRMRNAYPAKGSAFEKLGVNVRLRDIFRLAIMIEEKGRGVYLELEAKTDKPEVKKLCAWLADQEAEHRRFVQDHLNRWRQLPTHHLDWPKFLEKVREQGFFAEPPGEGAGEDELAAYAITQEVKSAEFYALFEDSFPEAWRKARLTRLVQEERSHELKIREAYPRLP